MLSLVLAALAGGVGLLLAARVHDFLKGEHLLRDLLDELQLARTDLRALDARWAATTERAPIVVSLTTTPTRLPFIAETLKSLLRQSRLPARIVLNLPAYSEREARAYPPFPALEGLAALSIITSADLGPLTKSLPTLLREASDQAVVVVDDDRIYPRDFLATLAAASERDKDRAFALSGWCVPADLTDRPTTLWSNLTLRAPTPIRAHRIRAPRPVDVMQGFAGYLVRPRFFDLSALSDFSNAPSVARLVDDVWLSAHCRVEKQVLPSKSSNYQQKRRMRLYHVTSLGLINRGDGGRETRSNSIMLRHFAARWQKRS